LKRFYKDVSITQTPAGYGIALDGRTVKTPAKKTLEVPKKALANAMAGEWKAQSEKILPETMPLNRLANTAIDRTAERFDEVLREALNFALHDLLCYRAEGPGELMKAEAKAWDPYLTWAEGTYSVHFHKTVGLASIDQPPETLKTLKKALQGMDAFRLTGLHNATTLTGSLVLALALEAGFKPEGKIWAAAHVDEDYQISKWGEDAEAKKVRAEKWRLFQAIDKFFTALS